MPIQNANKPVGDDNPEVPFTIRPSENKTSLSVPLANTFALEVAEETYRRRLEGSWPFMSPLVNKEKSGG